MFEKSAVSSLAIGRPNGGHCTGNSPGIARHCIAGIFNTDVGEEPAVWGVLARHLAILHGDHITDHCDVISHEVNVLFEADAAGFLWWANINASRWIWGAGCG